MRSFIKSASYIFHPLWMPLFSTGYYFMVTPRFFPPNLIQAKLLAIAITTIFIPVVFYFLLRNLGKANSVFLEKVQERRWPLFFYCLITGLNIYQILNQFNFPALYYFFVGILFASLTCLILAFFKVKVSLHMVALSGVFMFMLALSLYYQINLIGSIAAMVAVIGITATSRLQYNAHTYIELILGFFIGLLPQILVLNFWL